MKNSVSHRISSLILALIILTTSVGFSVDFHYCKSELKSFSLIGKAESCHTVKKSCPHHENMMITDNSEKDCCSNITIEFEDLDCDFNISSDVETTDIQLKFSTSFLNTFFSLPPPRVVESEFSDKHNPLPPMDIYVLLDRFLI